MGVSVEIKGHGEKRGQGQRKRERDTGITKEERTEGADPKRKMKRMQTVAMEKTEE